MITAKEDLEFGEFSPNLLIQLRGFAPQLIFKSMKKYTLIFLEMILLLQVKAQTELFTGFNSTMAGRSMTIGFSNTKDTKHEIGTALRININKLAHNDDQNKSYYKRLYATKPIHFFGLQGFYHKKILNKWEHLKPFLFYDLQATYSTSRNRMLLPYTYDANGEVLYKEYIEIFGPYTWVEQNIGIGFKADLFGNWFILQKLGFGTSFVLGYDKKRLDKYFNWFAWEFGYLFNVGIGYRFANHKNK
ncbi:MAG: hypothetical protein ABIK31_05565 [candidate division WOR-3 bacterium]